MTNYTPGFTQGPWEWDYRSDGKTIAIWGHDGKSSEDVTKIVATVHTFSGKECHNARLIASAPCLLEALELMVDQYKQVCLDNSVMGWPDMVIAAEILISRARGKIVAVETTGGQS